jgi:3-oxoacyl-[acyl-carrier protein] reductase
MLLSNKSAVLTGCKKGLGKKILEIFSKNNSDIFACVRNIDEEFENFVKNLSDKYNNKIIPISLDFETIESVKKAAKDILGYKIDIDILVNNAAIIFTAIFQMTSEEKLKNMFQINFFSQTVFTQNILKSITKSNNGSIIYISSSAAIDGNEGRSAYASSKASIIAQAKVLSREVGRQNIRVNTIAPGLTNTKMMIDSTPEKYKNELESRISLKRIGSPEEVANVALFLASNLSSYITGQTIRVDGGMHF